MWKAFFGNGFKKLPRPEKIGVLGIWAGSVVAIFGIFVAIWGIRASEDIALRSGAFDKPQLAVYLGKYRLTPGLQTNLAYGLQFEKQSLALVDLRMVIVNEGSKSAKGVAVIFRCPRFIALTDESIGKLKATATVPLVKNPERRITAAGNFVYIIWSLPDMNPGYSLDLGEPILLRQTRFEGSAQTKDNWTVGYSVDYSLDATISTSNDDAPISDYPLSITAIKAGNTSEMVIAFLRRMQGRHVQSGWVVRGGDIYNLQ